MDKEKFPKAIFVSRDENASGSDRARNKDLLAWEKRDDAVLDDGEYTFVAKYELVGVKKLKKEVVEVN